MGKRRFQHGNAVLEFTLCGIPLMFAWISTAQMSIGMWHYHTLQYAAKATAAYMAVRGSTYVSMGNAAPEVQDAANVMAAQAIGIPANEITVTWTAYKTDSDSQTVTCRLDNCQTNTTVWPPNGYNSPGMDLEITMSYTFRSALAMYVPGSGSVIFGSYTFPGHARQMIVF